MKPLQHYWYQKHPLRWLLWPLSLMYRAVTWGRRAYLERFSQQHFSVPIVVVGNITVGGVGKTPLVIALAKHMTAKGLRVGIVSRGYRAQIKHFPHEVSVTDEAFRVGDEPLLLAIKTACPVVIAPKRVDAVRYLLEKHDCHIILSDDGLQHYAMGRAIEIAVIEGVRQLGNGMCLPAGPLRESSKRLRQVDFIVVNGGALDNSRIKGYRMTLTPGALTNLVTDEPIDVTALTAPVAAVAGIGNPDRFFACLHELGIEFNPYPFADHHPFRLKDFHFREKHVVMTEKDAVKCHSFAKETWYHLPVEANLSDAFWQALWSHHSLQGFNS